MDVLIQYLYKPKLHFCSVVMKLGLGNIKTYFSSYNGVRTPPYLCMRIELLELCVDGMSSSPLRKKATKRAFELTNMNRGAHSMTDLCPTQTPHLYTNINT